MLPAAAAAAQDAEVAHSPRGEAQVPSQPPPSTTKTRCNKVEAAEKRVAKAEAKVAIQRKRLAKKQSEFGTPGEGTERARELAKLAAGVTSAQAAKHGSGAARIGSSKLDQAHREWRAF